jgi:chemotaxis family two-component system sensor kinase Cph1
MEVSSRSTAQGISDIDTKAMAECSREPIHIPGLIQPHGLLFVLDDALHIQQLSANTDDLIGRTPDSLIGQSILSLVSVRDGPSLEKLIRDAAFTFVNPFQVAIEVGGTTKVFDGIAHILEGVGTILELEQDADNDASAASTDGLDSYLQVVQRSLARISKTNEEIVITDIMAQEVKSFTGFDRVMVYRFEPDFHGHVIAEACEEDMEPYLGLHYPASDIPAQARELYLKNQVRLLQDVNARPVPLVPPLNPRTSASLDMSQSVLRAMSPVHVQYLKNMGVSASFSISLIVDDQLWGLIACHHRTPRFVPYAVRATLSLAAIVLSAQLRVKQDNQRNEKMSSARSLAISVLAGLREDSEVYASIPSILPSLVDLFEADGAALLTSEGTTCHGATPEKQVLTALREELGDGEAGSVIILNKSRDQFPSLADSVKQAAGLVAIQLGIKEWLVLFRKETSKAIHWAGDPNLAKTVSPSGVLTPRHSFEVWQETREGECEPWTEQTSVLTSEVRSGLLEIFRNRNLLLSRSNQDLRRFAGLVAHEVKGHLHTAVMALSLLEERLPVDAPPGLATLAANGREQLRGLADFTNEMLTFSDMENGAVPQRVELGELVSEVVENLRISGVIDGATVHLRELPAIMGHPTQMRHLFTNLIRNALIHGRAKSDQSLTVEIGAREEFGRQVVFVRDDGRGIPADQREKIFEYFYRGNSSASGSGIGLAFCAQVVERSGHRLWVEDSPTGGATFCFSVTVG